MNMTRPLVLTFLQLCLFAICMAQSPEGAALPEKFDGMREAIRVNHFPNPVLASEDAGDPGVYFWKHNTALMSATEDLTVIEGGAYLYYNDSWHLRVAYSAKEFCKLYDIRKCLLKAGQPYTFVNNWRRDSQLRGGWAMWYVIATTASGEKVYGVGLIDTVGEVYSE